MLHDIEDSIGPPKDGELTIILVAAGDDSEIPSDEYQTAVEAVRQELICHDPATSSYMLLMESAASSGWAYGVFCVTVALAGPHVGKALDTWFAARAGRKVRLKVGDIEAEAHSVAEVEKLLAHAKAIKDDEAGRKLL